jgi:hypothetical protein
MMLDEKWNIPKIHNTVGEFIICYMETEISQTKKPREHRWENTRQNEWRESDTHSYN